MTTQTVHALISRNKSGLTVYLYESSGLDDDYYFYLKSLKIFLEKEHPQLDFELTTVSRDVSI